MSTVSEDEAYVTWRRTSARAKREAAETLGNAMSMVDQMLAQPDYRERVSGQPENDPLEFVEHQCWRMLLVWPDEKDDTLPGKVECGGCGAIGRVEIDWRP